MACKTCAIIAARLRAIALHNLGVDRPTIVSILQRKHSGYYISLNGAIFRYANIANCQADIGGDLILGKS